MNDALKQDCAEMAALHLLDWLEENPADPQVFAAIILAAIECYEQMKPRPQPSDN